MSVSRFYVISDFLGAMTYDGRQTYVTGYLDERHELESDIKYAARFCSLERADHMIKQSSRKFMDPMIYLVEMTKKWGLFLPEPEYTFEIIETFDRAS